MPLRSLPFAFTLVVLVTVCCCYVTHARLHVTVRLILRGYAYVCPFTRLDTTFTAYGLRSAAPTHALPLRGLLLRLRYVTFRLHHTFALRLRLHPFTDFVYARLPHGAFDYVYVFATFYPLIGYLPLLPFARLILISTRLLRVCLDSPALLRTFDYVYTHCPLPHYTARLHGYVWLIYVALRTRSLLLRLPLPALHFARLLRLFTRLLLR